jgi:DNA-binding MurR/RpiR family transcriptional regulator
MEKYARPSRQLRAIVRFVLEQPTNVALETTATLARRAEMQPSALVRCAQSLGYEGFGALQQVLRVHVVPRFDTIRDRVATLGTLHRDGPGDPARVGE